MKVLITGAGGFIGSHLVERCLTEGYDVRAFLRYKSNNNWGWLEDSPCKKEIEIVAGDIRDYDSVFKATDSCDAIIHLAALIGIPYSYVSPLAYIKTNIEGTYNVLESAKNRSIQDIIITSTSETYGTAQYVPIDERHPSIGQSPYAASKIAADQLAISYHRSYELNVKIARPFNTYGPRQSARAVIPSIIIQILNGKSKIQLGNLTPTRDLTYVDDTVEGFIDILKNESLKGEIVNIGNNDEISIKNLVELISVLMEKKISVTTDKKRMRNITSEVERLRCDNSKLIRNTGWKPRVSLNDGLERTIQWVDTHGNSYKHEVYNV